MGRRGLRGGGGIHHRLHDPGGGLTDRPFPGQHHVGGGNQQQCHFHRNQCGRNGRRMERVPVVGHRALLYRRKHHGLFVRRGHVGTLDHHPLPPGEQLRRHLHRMERYHVGRHGLRHGNLGIFFKRNGVDRAEQQHLFRDGNLGRVERVHVGRHRPGQQQLGIFLRRCQLGRFGHDGIYFPGCVCRLESANLGCGRKRRQLVGLLVRRHQLDRSGYRGGSQHDQCKRGDVEWQCVGRRGVGGYRDTGVFGQRRGVDTQRSADHQYRPGNHVERHGDGGNYRPRTIDVGVGVGHPDPLRRRQ